MKVRAIIAPVLLIAALVGLWQAWAQISHAPEYLLPAPTAIAAALISNAALLTGSAWRTLAMSLEALAAASLFAGALALAVSLSQTLDRAIRPLAVALQYLALPSLQDPSLSRPL